MLIQDQFGIIQNLQVSPISQTSFLVGTFFAVSYSKWALEIKIFGFGSRIQDMAVWNKLNIELKYQSVNWLQCFWPLTDSKTMEVKMTMSMLHCKEV